MKNKLMSNVYCPYNHLKNGSEGCDTTTNQTSKINHQKDNVKLQIYLLSTIHIYNNIRKTQMHSNRKRTRMAQWIR